MNIVHECFTALLTAVARLLVTAEGRLNAAGVPFVHKYLAGANPLCDPHGAIDVPGKNTTDEAIVTVVGDSDGLGFLLIGEHGEHRAEYFGAGDLHISRHTGNDRGRQEKARFIGRDPARGNLSACLARAYHHADRTVPLAAVAGRTDLMRLFDKSQAGAQWLMQVGTLSGNPLASVAGLATLEVLSRPGTYEVMHDYGQCIQQMLHDALAPTGIPFQIVGDPMLFDVVFAETPIRDYRDTVAADKTAQGTFNRVLREHGILKSPAKIYPHLALTEADLDQTESAIQAAAKALTQ